MRAKPREEVPFRDGLFAGEADEAYLIGSRCRECGQMFFPCRPWCLECASHGMERVKMGQRGKLYSWTTSYLPSSRIEAPYTAGWIDLAEGVRIFSPLLKMEGRELAIGMEMGLVIDELWQEAGKRVMGYKYRPIL